MSSNNPGGGATPTPQNPPGVTIKLVQSGRKGWSRGSKVLASGCAGLAVLALGSCIFAGYHLKRSFAKPMVAGEQFIPRGPLATDNVLVIQADLEDGGTAEQFPVLWDEFTKTTQGSSDKDLPEALKFLRDANNRQSSMGVSFYLPVTVTVAWDEPAPLTSATVAAVSSGASAPEARFAGVVQYRGFASLLMKPMGAILEKAFGRDSDVVEEDGTRFIAGPPRAGDPDERKLISTGDRLIWANRVSLAKGLVAAVEHPGGAPPQGDPEEMLALLPKERQLTGLHRGPGAPAIVELLVERHRETAAARAEVPLEAYPAEPELPFDKSKLDAVAWSLTVTAPDHSRADVVLRFTTDDAASDALASLQDPKAPQWTWLSEIHVPSEKKTAERAGPRTIRVSVEGGDASTEIRAACEDGRLIEKARREASKRRLQKLIAEIEAAKHKIDASDPPSPSPSPSKKKR